MVVRDSKSKKVKNTELRETLVIIYYITDAQYSQIIIIETCSMSLCRTLPVGKVNIVMYK